MIEMANKRWLGKKLGYHMGSGEWVWRAHNDCPTSITLRIRKTAENDWVFSIRMYEPRLALNIESNPYRSETNARKDIQDKLSKFTGILRALLES
jgi:hypothetical protein